MSDDTVAKRNTGEILLLHHVGQLRTLCEAAEQSARVKFIAPGDTEGRVREGTVRHFVRGVDPSQWTFLSSDIDVRDAYLRITLSNGLDAVYPVRDLMKSVEDGEFVIAAKLV